ncbi:hypothetical protein [Segatella copri]|nr:hypothetical protein [Segatella copri]MDV3107532.1 hypothetical protein [Segatella copri]MDV3113959.1 hypothetical protein [Segatella copri]WOF89221.1 hypothetical protein RJT05_07825 [Segatella copri]
MSSRDWQENSNFIITMYKATKDRTNRPMTAKGKHLHVEGSLAEKHDA